ncbi:hypothetical protein CIB84_007713 [Bambusicola thoracicus]|uniref:Uncharacterized protein n=1 Tax=Bambusicola thoracicus TaxID=9083 RepID=A0A2P4SWT3_BAMTH|nr:hypothetical protein H355_000588 [Colinus virginianus]POI28536.1 hypothetical protein CIB84_007713 [Bambusicola thoracicus]
MYENASSGNIPQGMYYNKLIFKLPFFPFYVPGTCGSAQCVLNALGREVRGLWVARVLEEWGLEHQQDMVEGEKNTKAQTKSPDFRCDL